jgi:hypothetical protein
MSLLQGMGRVPCSPIPITCTITNRTSYCSRLRTRHEPLQSIPKFLKGERQAPASLPPLGDTGGGKYRAGHHYTHHHLLPCGRRWTPLGKAHAEPAAAGAVPSLCCEGFSRVGETAAADGGCTSGPGGRCLSWEMVRKGRRWRLRWRCSAAAWGAAAGGFGRARSGLGLGRAGHGRCWRWPAASRRISESED